VQLSDEDLASRLRNYEDPFVERKTAADVNDVTKTAVAFANSLPIGAPGVIFLPVRDDGTVQEGQDLDQLQRNITRRLNRAYPQIPSLYKIIRDDEKQLVAVVIWGSESRPHFSGPSYVRKGSESVEASEGQFNALIAQRNSKVYEILKWKGKRILVNSRVRQPHGWVHDQDRATVLECNPFYVSLEMGRGSLTSIPLDRVELSFVAAEQCLSLEVTH